MTASSSSSASRRDFLKRTAAYAALAVPAAAVVDVTRRMTSGGSAMSGAPGVTLVSKGHSTYAIVVLPDAPLTAQRGAKELQDHLKAMSGALLPIVTHDAVMAHQLPKGVTPGHLITIGAAPANAGLGEEAFRIQTQGTQVAITGGGPRGTLYGCSALLEDVLGVRWFTPHCTHIPVRPTITLPALDLHDAPAMGLRLPLWGEMISNRDWMVRSRVNSDQTRQVLDASVGGGHYEGTNSGENFSLLIPRDTYPQFWTGNELCLSDPALVPVAVAQLTTWMRAEPEAVEWAIAPDDNGPPCSCDGCQKINDEEGAPSGALIRFVNAVAAAIEPEFPHASLITLAYQGFEKPPKVTKPRSNVWISFAPLGACMAHALGTCDENRESYDNLVGWSKISHHLIYWHYSTDFANYLQPVPNLTAMCGDFAAFQRVGGVDMWSEGDFSSGGGGSFAELKAYLQAKLFWNPARDGRAIIHEFVTGVYGAGAPFIQQWIDAIEAEVVPGNGHGIRHAGKYDPPDAEYFPDSLLVRGVTLFDAAEQAAAHDPLALEQIHKARLALTFLQWQRAPKDSPERAKYKTLVDDAVKHFGITDMSE